MAMLTSHSTEVSTVPRLLLVSIVLWFLAAGLPATGFAADFTPTTPAPQGLRAAPESATIAPGNDLLISVTEDPTFNGIYQVRRGGYIILPQVGRIAVTGKTPAEAEAAVKCVLESNHRMPIATVKVELRRPEDVEPSPRIHLTGEFSRPGEWYIPTGITPTLVNVILSSGGVTQNADLARVRVVHVVGGKSVVNIVNVEKILWGGGLKSDLSLKDGDIILIPAGGANRKDEFPQPLRRAEPNSAPDFILGSLPSGGRT